MPKTTREIASEVNELLAMGNAKATRSKEWNDGFKYGAEAARDEWSRYGRSAVRETLDQLRAFARNDFDVGQVAGYEDALETFSLGGQTRQQPERRVLSENPETPERHSTLSHAATKPSRGAKSRALAINPALIAEKYRPFARSPSWKWWIHLPGSVSSIGEGSTEAKAWQAAADSLLARTPKTP